MTLETRSIRVSLTDAFNDIRVVGATVKTTVGDLSTGISRQTKISDANGYVYIEEVKNGSSVIFGHPISLEISKDGYKNYTVTKTWQDLGLDHIVWDIFLQSLSTPIEANIQVGKLVIEPEFVKVTDRINISATIIDVTTGLGAVGWGYTMIAISPTGRNITLADGKVFFSDGDVSISGLDISSLNPTMQEFGQWRIRLSVAQDARERGFSIESPLSPTEKPVVMVTARLQTSHRFGIGSIGDQVLQEYDLSDGLTLDESGIDNKDLVGRIIKHHQIDIFVEANFDFNETHSFTVGVIQNERTIFTKTFNLIGQALLDFDPRKEDFNTGFFKPSKNLDKYAVIVRDNTKGVVQSSMLFTIDNQDTLEATPTSDDDFFKKIIEFLTGSLFGIPNIVFIGLGLSVVVILAMVAKGSSPITIISDVLRRRK